MRKECPELVTITHARYDTIETAAQLEDTKDSEGIDKQPNEDMS